MIRIVASLAMWFMSGCGGATSGITLVEEPPRWDGCRETAFPISLEGTRTWAADGTALYCAAFSEFRTFDEEQAAKAQLRVHRTAVALSDDQTEADVGWCLQERSGEIIASDDLTRLRVESTSGIWFSTATTTLGAYGIEGVTRYPDDASVALWDGVHHGPYDDVQHELRVCDGPCETATSSRGFDACRFDEVALHRHIVGFEGGSLELDIRIGDLLIATQPGILEAARGSLDGVSFDITSYWDLVYVPSHHHVFRSARVILPEPIGDAVALEIEGLTTPPADAVLWAVDADGARIAELAVTSESFEFYPPGSER